MTVSYRIDRKQSNIGEKTSKYYALPVQTGNVGTRQLAGEVTQSSSLTQGDVYATLIGLSQPIEHYPHKGYSVRLDALDTFSLSASNPDFDKPEACKPRHVKAKKHAFDPTEASRKT